MKEDHYAKLTPEKISKAMKDPDTSKVNPPRGLADKLRSRAGLLNELADVLETVGPEDPLFETLKWKAPQIVGGAFPTSEQLAELEKGQHASRPALLDAFRKLVSEDKGASK